MTMPRIGRLGLQARLVCLRAGCGAMVAVLLCAVAAIGALLIVPQLEAQRAAQRASFEPPDRMLASAQDSEPVIARSDADTRLAAFYATLGERRDIGQQVKKLFAIAKDTGLLLNQAEYKLARDPGGRFHTYQIVLPVKGTYAEIRPFCEQVLLAIPYASLDEIAFKRDAIGSLILEARLRLTLYLGDGSISGEPAEQRRAPVLQAAAS